MELRISDIPLSNPWHITSLEQVPEHGSDLLQASIVSPGREVAALTASYDAQHKYDEGNGQDKLEALAHGDGRTC